jgi:hypothetical protein
MKRLLLLFSHLASLAVGFALGVHALPILNAPEAPSVAEVQTQAGTGAHMGQFRRDLKDSDALHWGEGAVSVSSRSIGLMGELAPGPDYKLYLSPQFVETEARFKELKPSMVRVGDVKRSRTSWSRCPRRSTSSATTPWSSGAKPSASSSRQPSTSSCCGVRHAIAWHRRDPSGGRKERAEGIRAVTCCIH